MEINGEPWVCGKDVADALGYKNTKDALITHVDDEDKRIVQRSEIATLENHLPKDVFPFEFVTAEIPNRGLTFINESGLYSLILSSKLPKAKRFKRWVTSEVLPALRKNHTYTMPGEQQSASPHHPTRPLTTEDYRDAAYNIRKCPKDRVALVVGLYRMAGLEMDELLQEVDEQQQPDDGVNLVQLLSPYTLKELEQILNLPKATLSYYKNGKFAPRGERRKFIIKTLMKWEEGR